MTAPTLTEFLLARIAEDRIVANQSQRDPWRVGHKSSCDWWGDMPGYCSCDATARALAECEARRRIVQFHGSEMLEHCQEGCPGLFPCRTLSAIAAVYSDHLDFREEWRP